MESYGRSLIDQLCQHIDFDVLRKTNSNTVMLQIEQYPQNNDSKDGEYYYCRLNTYNLTFQEVLKLFTLLRYTNTKVHSLSLLEILHILNIERLLI